MKSVLALLCSVLATATVAFGQGLSIELVLDQEQYLAGESLPLKVRIANSSGQNLPLGKQENWLEFTIEDSRHLLVARQGRVPVAGEFTLEQSTTGTKKVDLAPYFDLSSLGRYYVRATVEVPQWGKTFQTKPVPFDIIKGSSLWEQEFGMPSPDKDGTATPKVRQYALIQTLHSKTIKLYFRLSEAPKENVLRIYPLGPMVSFSNPEPQIDQFSNLHVLYQSSGRIFLHCLINPDGLLISRETYEYSERRPVLRPESDGRITVAGGTRRVMPNDLPPPISSYPVPNAKLDQP